MSENQELRMGSRGPSGKLPHRFRMLLHRFLYYIGRGIPRPEFLRQACHILMELSGCDAVEIRIDDGGKISHSRVVKEETGEIRFAYTICSPREEEGSHKEGRMETVSEELLEAVLHERVAAAAPFRTRSGSFWTSDAARPLLLRDKGSASAAPRTVVIGGKFPSLALFPVSIDENSRAVLLLGSRRRDFFSHDDVLFYEAVAENLGAALAHQGAQWALRERVKELTCLYEIAMIAQSPGISMPTLLQKIVDVLPPAWQYPELTEARLTLDEQSYQTAGFAGRSWRQAADIVVKGRERGLVEVEYTQAMPEYDEGPFLKEERSLINEVARQVGLIIEQRETEQERARLQEQLRHADRLATIGQLAAGAAHELNEPLLSILGFSQLIKKTPDLGPEVIRDLEKIEAASLSARDVVQKLLIFARHMRTRKSSFNLNGLIRKGLYILESRCEKEGIQLIYRLDPRIPDITADSSQIQQVLVNLVLNAMQATPQGGRIALETHARDDHVIVVVEDTGAGMTKEVLDQIFVPFFTTKEIGRGTGLGLSVVHGIVTSHGGQIRVTSEPGKGTRFEVLLPVKPTFSSEEAPQYGTA